MKKALSLLAVGLMALTATAQTLNVQVGNVTYQFPAAQAGEMTYSDGTTLTIMGKEFTLSDITSMTVDNSEVTDNLVTVAYSGTSATVKVAGNVAQYVEPTISNGYVSIAQSNTDAVDDDEITYQLSGTSTDGQFALSGSYKCTVALAGVNLTCTTGAAINIANKKRIQLSAKKGTENTLADCAGGEQNACIYSKGQLQLQGNGTLNVVGNSKHGIKSGDYITVKNLTLNITSAVKDGLCCNEYFLMKSGTVTISGVGDDGIQADLDGETSTGEIAADKDAGIEAHDDEDSGNIYIEGGTLTVTVPSTTTAGKCLKAEGDISVSDGTVKLYANGAIDLNTIDAQGYVDPSYTAGFKADGGFTQSGGDITINVQGAAGRGIACEGTFTSTTDNAGKLTINNTGVTKSTSTYFCTARGIKAGEVDIKGGTIDVTMSGAASKGIKSDIDDGSGNMTISGGTITVECTGGGATDQLDADGKGCAGLNADYDMLISGGTITLTSTGTGGKGLKCDSTLTITGGTLTAQASGSNYSSGNYSASAKAIKAGARFEVEGTTTSRAGSFPGGGGQPGGGGGQPGGGGGQPGGGDNKSYTYRGGIVISGGTIVAIASNHEAIESKSTIEITDGYVYAESSDDAINSASDFTISGGYVMGNSSGNDGLDANGDFYIEGGNVFAVATTTPEVGIDANTEGGKQLCITGGNVVAIGGLESGSSLTGVTSKSASYSKGNWYSFQSGGTTKFYFKVPSNSKMPSNMTIVSSSTPSVSTASSVTSNIWNGYGKSN